MGLLGGREERERPLDCNGDLNRGKRKKKMIFSSLTKGRGGCP